MLQKLENKQFQDLAMKAQVAREQHEKRFESEMCTLLRNYDNDVEALNRQQKTLVEKAEAQQELDMKFASKKIRSEQEREIKQFKDSIKNEYKLLKQETELLPKDKRKDVYKVKKDKLDSELAEKEREFLASLNDAHDMSIRRLSEGHREKIALLERQFLQQKQQLLRAKEAATWELEERHMHERQQLAKRQLKDIFFLQRHQMLVRHEKVCLHLLIVLSKKKLLSSLDCLVTDWFFPSTGIGTSEKNVRSGRGRTDQEACRGTKTPSQKDTIRNEDS